MRGSATLALALFALALLWLAARAGPWQLPFSQEGGQLDFSPESVDLGRVPLGVSAPFRFQMTNAGGKPVRIVGKPQIRALEGC